MYKKQYAVFFLVILAFCGLLSWYLFFRQPAKDELSIIFVDQEVFKVGEDIDPIDLVKSSSSAKILYPAIDSSSPGVKNLLYIAVGEHGEQKEFLKTIKIIDPTPPSLELKEERVELTEGASFDPKAYIQKAEDAYDGELPVNITGEYDVDRPGTYTITYSITNSSDLTTRKELRLIINEKRKKETTDTDDLPARPSREDAVVPETGTTEQTRPTISTQREWYVSESYGFEAARADCMDAGKQGSGTFTCEVITDEYGIAKGYRLVS